jgi:hypothetical protein
MGTPAWFQVILELNTANPAIFGNRGLLKSRIFRTPEIRNDEDSLHWLHIGYIKEAAAAPDGTAADCGRFSLGPAY